MTFRAIPIVAERHIGWDPTRRPKALFISKRNRDPQVKILIINTDTHTRKMYNYDKVIFIDIYT